MNDLRLAFRQLLKSPGFSLVAVITLALGIGANTAIFSVINSALLQPLRYADPERLVQIVYQMTGPRFTVLPGPHFQQWRDHATTFTGVAGIHDRIAYNLIADGRAERVTGAEVSANYLDVLGIRPLLGRGFQPGEDVLGGNRNVVVLTHEWWQNRLGADPAILNRTINFNNASYTVVGILPPDVLVRERVNFLVPLILEDGPWRMDPANPWVEVVARLRPGVTLTQAQGEVNAIGAELDVRTRPEGRRREQELLPLHEILIERSRPTLLMLLGAVALVLLIACANVANLLLARATGRQKEMAIRTAMGASVVRIVRQVLTESVVLSLCGGLLGLVVALVALRFLTRMTASELPAMMRPELDWPVLGFSLLLAAGTGILFGIFPALQATRTDVNRHLKDAGRGSSGSRSRVQSVLIVSEVALTVVLLVGAGLLLRSFARVLQVDPGFNSRQALVCDVSLTETRFGGEETVLEFHRELLRRVQAVPGIAAVGTSTTLPLAQNVWGARVGLSERPIAEHDQGSQLDYVGGDYFQAMGMKLTQGRWLETTDNASTAPRVVVINQRLAANLLPGENPIGRRIHFSNTDWEIVGIVGDVRHGRIDGPAPNRMYAAHAFSPYTLCLVMRTTVAPLSLVDTIRRTAAELDPEQSVANFRTLEQSVSRSLDGRRVTLYLLGFFAVVALALASLGVYGVMSYTIGQRERELSIRMALGAQRHDVVQLVLRDGLRLGLIGIALGLAAGLAGSRLIASRLYEIGARDPLVFVLATSVISLVAASSVYFPARRAARADALLALRAE